MKYLTALLCSVGFWNLCTPAGAGTFELRVGSCPTPLSFQFVGNWENSYLSEEAADALRSNPARNAIVIGVFLNDLMPNASMSVMSLGSLDRAQGTLSEEQFWHLAELFERQVREPDPAIFSQLQERLESYAGGGGYETPTYMLRDYILTGPDRFVTLGASTSSVGEFLTAGLFHYSASCIVSVQIGIPESRSLDALLDALHSIHIRISTASD